MVDKLLSQAMCVYPAETIWNFDYLATATLFQTAPDALGLSGMTVYPASRRKTSISIARCGFSALCEKCKNEVNVTTLARRVEVLLTKRLQVQRFTNA